MLEDAQYKYVIADSKLGTIENEKKQEIEDLKEKVCRWGLSCDCHVTLWVRGHVTICGIIHLVRCPITRWNKHEVDFP